MKHWVYAESVGAERQIQLGGWQAFEDIAVATALVAEIDSAIWEKGADTELLGCGRAAYKLRVPSHVYDAFFNSSAGYRAQYAVSPEQGEKSNSILLDTLRTLLLATAPASPIPRGVELSLAGAQAKVWIDETEVESHLFCDAPEILFPRWLQGCEFTAGARAPVGTRLVVYGGWVDSNGYERINPKKTRRSQEIHDCGFS